MKGSKETLADTLGIEMPEGPEAKELTAEVNDTENLVEVVLELSNAKLADAEKLANKDNYRVDKLKVVRVTVDGDNVILQLDKTLVKNRSYDLTVRNIDKAINKKYSFKAYDNASPKVVDVKALGEYGIKVTLSEPVDPDKVKETDFLVDGKNIAMNLETYGRVLVLTPYHKSAFAANAEKLTVKGLEDFAGYKSALEAFEIEIVKDTVAPVVEDVVVKGNVVEVTFDKDIYADSVEGYQNRKDEGNISYRDGRNTIFTKQATTSNEYGNKIDTNKVAYEFKDNLPRGTEVTIEGVQNHSKVAMEKTTLGVREVKDNLEPEIIDVDVNKRLADNEATITLEFDKAVYGFENAAKTEFDVAKHFTLYTEEVLKRNIVNGAEGKVVSAKYDGTDKTKIVVELENLQENNNDKDYDYILEVVDFEDGSRNRMYRDYYEFELKAGKTLVVEDIKIVEDTKRDETVVTIDFNYAVDRVRAEDGTNYLFRTKAGVKSKDAKELDGDIVVSRNGKTVTITLPGFKYADYKVNGLFEITEGLRDKDGNKLAKAVVHKFVDNYKDEVAKEEAEKAVPKDAAAAQVAYLAAGGLATNPLYVAVTNALEADPQVLADIKAATTALKNATKDLVDAAADQAIVDAELAKVEDLELPSTATANQATIEAAVEALVDLNKVSVVVPAAAAEANGKWKITLNSKIAGSTATADKEITVKVALSADQIMVDAELAKVDDVELAAGTDLTTDQSALVKTAVEAKVDLNKVIVTVATGADDNTYNVKLDSKVAAGTANKDIQVTATS